MLRLLREPRGSAPHFSSSFFGGASELLEVNCGGGQLLRVRIFRARTAFREHDFIFSIADAIRVQE